VRPRPRRSTPKMMAGRHADAKVTFFRGQLGGEAYQLLQHMGRGAYGDVWAARKRDGDRTSDKVAIKKIANCFVQATEAKRILRELRILRHLTHPNIIRIRDVLEPQNETTFSDLCVVFDFVDLDLRKLIASPQTITVAHVQWICHQILAALLYLHSAHVLHRDLKPANVLLSGTCEVKICDFGLARVIDEADWDYNEKVTSAHALKLERNASTSSLGSCPKVTRQMTTHVVTRWYRAPELILLQRYTTAIDMWSFACILAELLTMLPNGPSERNALFPGRSCFPLSPTEDELSSPASLDQLNVIFSVIGSPQGPFEWVDRTEMREHLTTLTPISPTALEDLLPGSPPQAIALLQSLLQFKPSRRPSVREAMDHPFFDGMATRCDPVLATRPVDAATIDFEHAENKLPQVRRKILGEVKHYASLRHSVGGVGSSSADGDTPAGNFASSEAAAGGVNGQSEGGSDAAAHVLGQGGHGCEGELDEEAPSAKRRRRSSRESSSSATEGAGSSKD